MLKTLKMSFKLRNAYKTNGVIFSLKSLPLIKKLLPASLYASRGLKTFANIISIIIEFFSVFLGKGIYVSLMIFYVATLYKIPYSGSFIHMFIFLTIIGGLLNTCMFNPTKDKYYALCLLRMDAKQYALVNYWYFILKMLVGFMPFTIMFGLLCDLPLYVCILMPFYVCEVKVLLTAQSFLEYKRTGGKVKNENKWNPVVVAATIALLVAAYLPPVLGIALEYTVFCIIAAVLLIPAILSVNLINKFQDYRYIYREMLKPENFVAQSRDAALRGQQIAMQKKIETDTSITSNKTGYKYFNELFMKRHAKLLTKSAKRLAIAAVALVAVVIGVCYVLPDEKAEINELILTYLPYFLFVMYMTNRGKAVTRAMFMNCDHSMLAYRSYRQPKAILQLFVDRLKYVILIDLIPSIVIALGLPLVLLVSGGTDEPLNYLVLFVSIIAMSIFFSVHNMVLYYLLQPYNVNLEMKSAGYVIINYITYFICYFAIGKSVPTLIFGSAVSAFCILYAILASLLAYKLAPKTFRLRG